MFSGVSGNFDSNVFNGEAAYLLGTAVESSQADRRAILYTRLGLSSSASAGDGTTTTTTTSSPSGGGGTVVTITYKPGSPATAAVPSANGKPGKPAKPAVPPSTEIAFGGSASNSGTSAGAGAGASNSAADLGLASIGSVYTAINDYHVGCTVRIGLNQLQNKLNTPSAAKTTTPPAAASATQ